MLILCWQSTYKLGYYAKLGFRMYPEKLKFRWYLKGCMEYSKRCKIKLQTDPPKVQFSLRYLKNAPFSLNLKIVKFSQTLLAGKKA